MSTYDFKDIQEKALGQWPELLLAFGVPWRAKQKNGPCPLCGGDDRAHWKNTGGRSMLYCRHCGTHWGDQVVLEACFNGDFAKMCQELGDWLHCQPAERKTFAKTKAKIAVSTGGDSAEIERRIEQSRSLPLSIFPTNKHLLSRGLGADCYMDGESFDAYFPMTVKGEIIDWIKYTDEGQSIASGKVLTGSAFAIRPSSEPKKNVFITANVMDALYLFECGKRENLVLCSGDLKNLGKVAALLPDKYRPIMAVSNDLDSLETIQTLPYDFVMPDEVGRSFCEIDYRHKPTKIHPASEAGPIFYRMLDGSNA